MKTAVYNQKGEKTGDLTLSDCFSVDLKSKALTEYVNYLRSALRNPVANSKDRSQVSGGGKKPWKQKGTGNARVGSNRSPLWVGGGVTFGPLSAQNFKKRINAREKKRVILGIIGDFFENKKAYVVENLNMPLIKTKNASSLLQNFKADGKIGVIVSLEDENSLLSFRNIGGIDVMRPNKMNMIHIISSDSVIMSKKALSEIEEIFSVKKAKVAEKIEKAPTLRSESAPNHGGKDE